MSCSAAWWTRPYRSWSPPRLPDGEQDAASRDEHVEDAVQHVSWAAGCRVWSGRRPAARKAHRRPPQVSPEWVRKASSAILLERARDQGQRTGMSMPHTSATCRVTPPTAWKAQLPFSDGWETITARHGRAAARGRTAPILSPNSCLAKFEGGAGLLFTGRRTFTRYGMIVAT